MIKRTKYNKIKESLNVISEGITKVAEDATLDELETKLNIIIDALGLEDSVKDKEEKTEEVVEETSDNEDEIKLENLTINESLDTASDFKPYSIQFLDTRAYATDLDKVKDDFTSINSIDFDSLENLVDYLDSKNIAGYSTIGDIYSVDSVKDSGLIYVASWYEVIKNQSDVADNEE